MGTFLTLVAVDDFDLAGMGDEESCGHPDEEAMLDDPRDGREALRQLGRARDGAECAIVNDVAAIGLIGRRLLFAQRERHFLIAEFGEGEPIDWSSNVWAYLNECVGCGAGPKKAGVLPASGLYNCFKCGLRGTPEQLREQLAPSSPRAIAS